MVTGLLQIVQSRYPITVSSLPKELDTYALFSTCVTTFVRVRFQNEYRQVEPGHVLRQETSEHSPLPIFAWPPEYQPHRGQQPARLSPWQLAFDVGKRSSQRIHLMLQPS